MAERTGLGITPAYAGKSASAQILRHLYRDHPRVCGEKYISLPPYFFFVGSPPRMRGKEGTPLENLPKDRITPAYAGKRLCR